MLQKISILLIGVFMATSALAEEALNVTTPDDISQTQNEKVQEEDYCITCETVHVGYARGGRADKQTAENIEYCFTCDPKNMIRISTVGTNNAEGTTLADLENDIIEAYGFRDGTSLGPLKTDIKGIHMANVQEIYPIVANGSLQPLYEKKHFAAYVVGHGLVLLTNQEVGELLAQSPDQLSDVLQVMVNSISPNRHKSTSDRWAETQNNEAVEVPDIDTPVVTIDTNAHQ